MASVQSVDEEGRAFILALRPSRRYTEHHSKTGRSAMNRLMTALILLFLFAAPVFSQSVPTGGPPPIDRRNADRIRQQDISQREYQLRNFGTEPNKPKDDRELKARMEQTE